jgi:hypothetical protein
MSKFTPDKHPRVFIRPVFFYSDDCPRCIPTLKKVLDKLSCRNISMLIKKPTPQELSNPGFAFPALYIPPMLLGNKSGMLLVGEGIADHLDTLTP